MESAETRALWTALKFPLTRSQLDARQSGDETVSHSVLPLEQLASIFNNAQKDGNKDTNTIIYKNMTCKYNAKDEKLDECVGTVAGHIIEESIAVDVIYEKVKDIDPTKFHKRDADWIKDKSSEIRKFLKETFSEGVGFFRSGQQDAENMYSAWSDFCSFGGRPAWTHAQILTPSGLDFMRENRDDGKGMGIHGSDTGLPSHDVEFKQKRKYDATRQKDFRDRKKSASPANNEDDSVSVFSSPAATELLFGTMIEKLNSSLMTTNAAVNANDNQTLEASLKYKKMEIQVQAASALQNNADSSAREKGTQFLLNLLND